MADADPSCRGPINAAGLEMTLETGSSRSSPTARCSCRSATPRCCRTVAPSKPREGIDFFPLTVDVEERMYAAGKIPGSFFRREGRPGEQAILTCRLTDRPLRPSFPERLPQRGAGHRHHPRRRPREPARRRVDQRRVGRAHGVGHPVQRPDRRGAPRAPRRRVDRAPDVPGGRRVDVRDRRRRPQARRRRHRDHDGRGRRHRGHVGALRSRARRRSPKRSIAEGLEESKQWIARVDRPPARARARTYEKAHGPIEPIDVRAQRSTTTPTCSRRSTQHAEPRARPRR